MPSAAAGVVVADSTLTELGWVLPRTLVWAWHADFDVVNLNRPGFGGGTEAPGSSDSQAASAALSCGRDPAPLPALGLPDIDGLTVLGQLRQRGVRMPIIVLTARDGVRDRVDGLDRGADDYLTKPFAVAELLARVRARTRATPDEASTTVLRTHGVEIDLLARRVLHDGREFVLSARELLLAETFLRHPGQVLSREQLLDRVWG